MLSLVLHAKTFVSVPVFFTKAFPGLGGEAGGAQQEAHQSPAVRPARLFVCQTPTTCSLHEDVMKEAAEQ